MTNNLKSRNAEPYRYCVGCGHRIMHNLLARCIDELGIRHKTIGIAPVGCAVFAYDYFNIDMLEAPHGRPPAVATGIKRVQPDSVVFTYQGDGDLAAIGLSEILHTASRGENITVFFVNNATYGMTGGQMAPTTLMGQRTTTTREGRSEGSPMKISELIASFDNARFVARGALDTSRNMEQTRQYMMQALTSQIDNKGFSFVEVLSACPTDWHMNPMEAAGWICSTMSKEFPCKVLVDRSADG